MTGEESGSNLDLSAVVRGLGAALGAREGPRAPGDGGAATEAGEDADGDGESGGGGESEGEDEDAGEREVRAATEALVRRLAP